MRLHSKATNGSRFGGNVSVSQLVDFHQGAVHDEDLYDESQLQGFVDEAKSGTGGTLLAWKRPEGLCQICKWS